MAAEATEAPLSPLPPMPRRWWGAVGTGAGTLIFGLALLTFSLDYAVSNPCTGFVPCPALAQTIGTLQLLGVIIFFAGLTVTFLTLLVSPRRFM